MSDDIDAFMAAVAPAKRRRDGETLLELYARATGLEPRLRGSIIGYGDYHYRYASGREGDIAAAAFAPRKAATSIYLMDGVDTYRRQLAQLGPHKTGVGCLYLRDLAENDLAVLEEIVRSSFIALTAGDFSARARDGQSEP